MDEQNASANRRKICFVDRQGKELFEISDNECIELIYGDGSYYIGICRYVDEWNFILDGVFWNIHDFAKRMEKSGIIYRKYIRLCN